MAALQLTAAAAEIWLLPAYEENVPDENGDKGAAIFANGTTIYIDEAKADAEKTVVYYYDILDTEKKTPKYVNPSGSVGDDLSGVRVYGGFYGEDYGSANPTVGNFPTCIRINGGTVKGVYGGGLCKIDGAKTLSAEVYADTYIYVMEGAEIGWNVINGNYTALTDEFCIFGGGGYIPNSEASSKVHGTAYISIAGTVYGSVFGAGYGAQSPVGAVNITVEKTGSVEDILVSNGYNDRVGGEIYGAGCYGACLGAVEITAKGKVEYSIYGAGLQEAASAASAEIVVDGGDVGSIWGAGIGAPVTDAASIVVKNEAAVDSTIYGAGYHAEATVASASISVEEGCSFNYIYGGGNTAGVLGSVSITSAGDGGNIYGSCKSSSAGTSAVTGPVDIAVTGGKATYVYGEASTTGSISDSAKVNITVSGGLVSADISVGASGEQTTTTQAGTLTILGGSVQTKHDNFVTTDGKTAGTAAIHVYDSSVTERDENWTGMIALSTDKTYIVSGTAVVSDPLPGGNRYTIVIPDADDVLTIEEGITLVRDDNVTNNGTINGDGKMVLSGYFSSQTYSGTGTVAGGALLYGISYSTTNLEYEWKSGTALREGERYASGGDIVFGVKAVGNYKISGMTIRSNSTRLESGAGYNYDAAAGTVTIYEASVLGAVTISISLKATVTTAHFEQYYGSSSTMTSVWGETGMTFESQWAGYTALPEGDANYMARICADDSTYAIWTVQDPAEAFTISDITNSSGNTTYGTNGGSVEINSSTSSRKCFTVKPKTGLPIGTYTATATLAFDESRAEDYPRFDTVTYTFTFVVKDTLHVHTQPQDLRLEAGYETGTLTVGAEKNSSLSGTIAYQWYVSGDNASFSAVSGATGTSFSVPETAGGVTKYYKCTVSCGSKSVDSRTAAVTFDAPGVARVSDADGVRIGSYADLQVAVNAAAASPDAVLLLRDNVSLVNPVSVTGGRFTLDLGGKKIESSSYVLSVSGETAEVVVTDTSAGKTGVLGAANAAKPSVYLEKAKVLTLLGGALPGSTDIEYHGGMVDISGYPDVSGIGIDNRAGADVTASAICLPQWYVLTDADGKDVDSFTGTGLYTVARYTGLCVSLGGEETREIRILNPGTYKVVYADYEGSKMVKLDIVPVTVTGNETEAISAVGQNTANALGKGDKVMLWSDATPMQPLQKAITIQ